ncbi:hypothetical protein [Candidatus Vidania fulgoroideorum]
MNYIYFKDLNKKQYLKIFKYCFLFKKKKKKKINKTAGLYFALASTRTKTAFFIACKNLNINLVEIKLKELQYKRGESLKDTFKILSLYYDILILRKERISKIIKYFKKPILNALNKQEHPSQIINDLFTIIEIKKTLKLKITWIGKCNNIFKSLYSSYKIFKFKLKVFSLKKDIKKFNIKNQICAKRACINTNVIMTDTWNSMGYKKKKYPSLKVKNKYIGNAIFMHCLPMYIGQEINSEVIKNKNCIIWKQAKNKIFSTQALLYYLLK